MRKILFLIPNLEYGGATNRTSLLARKMPRDQFDVMVCASNGQGPLGAELRAADIPVVDLGWQRLLDLRPLGQLRKTLRAFQPDLIQVSGLPALRFLILTAGRVSCKLVARDCLGPDPTTGIRGWLDRKLLALADCVVANSRHELERAKLMGLPADRVVYLPPGAVNPKCGNQSNSRLPIDDSRCQDSPLENRKSKIENPLTPDTCPLPIPAHARLIAGIGPLEPAKGYRDAIWALDILRHLHDDVHLLLIGSGADRPRLDDFSRIAGVTDRVHYVERAADTQSLLAVSEIVWVPSWTDRGMQVCLEAMAAGKPVVAARWPGLAEVIVDGKTGILITPEDKGDLARQTHLLLENVELCQRMGEAGRQRALSNFDADMATERAIRLMDSILVPSSESAGRLGATVEKAA